MIYRGDYTRNICWDNEIYESLHKDYFIMNEVREQLRKKDILYSYLNISDIKGDLLDKFNRYQKVNYIVRNIEGIKQLIYSPYIDNWDDTMKHEIIYTNFRQCLLDGGIVISANYHNYLIGFASLLGKPLDNQNQAYILSQLHISYEFRRFHIGTELFRMCLNQVKEWGGKKIYIQVHQAYETHEFYKAMGCVDTKEASFFHGLLWPYDCQMEYRL